MQVKFGLTDTILLVCQNMKFHFASPNWYGSSRLSFINRSYSGGKCGIAVDYCRYASKDANTRAMASLDRVGLRNKAHYLPPQISGGNSNALILRVRLCINLSSYWQMNQRVI